MQRIRAWVIAAILWTMVLAGYSSLAFGSDNPIKFRRYSLAQGLSQGTVSDLVQDKQGFIWIATQDGLNRFDGYQFKVFRHKNSPGSLSSDYIQSLFVDRDGVLWIGTRKGLSRLNPDTETFTTFTLGQETREHIGSQYIDTIAQADNGNLWVGTMDGLFLFDPNQGPVKVYRNNPQQSTSLSSNHVYALLNDDDKLYVGTDQGLNVFYPQTEQFEHIRHDPAQPNTLSGDNISDIVKDQYGMLWVATYDSGLNLFNPRIGKVIEHYYHSDENYHSLGHDRVRSLHIDQYQQLWVGTRGGISLFVPKRNHFINYRNDPAVPSSLSNDHIWAIYEDNNDSLWFATGDGINQFVQSTQAFGHHHKTSTPGIGISHKRVRALHKTTDNVLWIGVDNGLNRYDPITGKYQYFMHDPNDNSTITKGMVMSILVDSKKQVWAGTYDGGLSLMLANGKFKQYTPTPDDRNSLSHSRVYSIMEDAQGYLWLGTLDGLNRFDPQTTQFERFYHDPNNPFSLGNNGIYDTIQSPQGDIWIATRNGGVNRYDSTTGQFTRYEHDPQNPHSLSHNRVFALYQSNPNALWLATSNGLNLMHIDSGRFELFAKEHGLLNKTVYGVTGDNQGNIWVSTNRGLARFDPKKRRFKTFTHMHGLQSDEFNNGAFFKALDGELFFGGIDGYNRFYPSQIRGNDLAPHVVITQFYLANKTPDLKADAPSSPLEKVINRTTALALDHQHPVFSFEFSAMHYLSPKDNRYAFMLDGFDKRWTYTGADHRRATYTNLPSGHYRFRVKAANSDGLWSEQDSAISIYIAPAPWLTWWAYLLYAFIVGGTMSAFVYQRWQKQKAISESENRLSLALWGSGNEFWDWDIKAGNLVRSNNSGEFALPCGQNYSIDSLQVLVHPEDFDKVQQAFTRHAGGQTDYFECAYRMRNADGQWIWVLDRGQVVKRDEQGRPTRAIGTVQNINNMKQIEAQLRALNEELEQRVEARTAQLNQTVASLANANDQLRQAQEQLIEAEKMAALASLVAGIAHEINTPIGICITSTSVLSDACLQFFNLQEDKKLTLSDFQRFKQTCGESLKLIAGNLEKTDYLVQSFKRVSVQQTTDDATECNLGELLRQLIEIRASQLNESQITVNLNCTDRVSIYSHYRSLELLFDQLLENSIKHGFAHGNGGTITITIEPNATGVNILYCDNGSGLSQQGREKLFEPFYTTERGQGHLGLGMHIIYNHVSQRLKGSIEIDDSQPQGLAYRISLPRL